MTDARISQIPVEVVHEGDPQARVSQLPVEVLVVSFPFARYSQLPVEVVQRALRETVTVVIWD